MPSNPSNGFQAIILCGPGTSLYPFTGAVDLPKALLPVANRPMLYYPIEWCDKAGFDTILILTLTEHQNAIQSYLRSHRAQKSTIDIRVESPSSLDECLGTADVIRIAHRKGWINGDFAVLPCDLVTTIDAQEVVEMWMVEQAGFDSDLGRRPRMSEKVGDADDGRRGGLGIWYETRGEGAYKGMETDFVTVAPQVVKNRPSSKYRSTGTVSSLLLSAPIESVRGADDASSEFPIRHSLLRKHPKLQLYTTRRDSGIYFFPYWILKFIERNPKMSSIREDVLPWWAKCCWQNRRLAGKLGLLDILVGNHEEDDTEDLQAGIRFDVGSMSTTRTGASPLPKRAPLAVPSEKPTPVKVLAREQVQIPEITAYLPDASKAFTRRVDTVHLYLFTSLYLAKTDPEAGPSQLKIDPSASIDPKAIVTAADCLVADKVTIGEKAVIKRSVLGSGVSIGKGARLIGCVLMDGASVAEGARLEGCTVGRKAIIGVKANLKDCGVAEGFVIEEGTEAKNETFVAELDAEGSGVSAIESEETSDADSIRKAGADDSESPQNDGSENSEIGGDVPAPAFEAKMEGAPAVGSITSGDTLPMGPPPPYTAKPTHATTTTLLDLQPKDSEVLPHTAAAPGNNTSSLKQVNDTKNAVGVPAPPGNS